MKSIRRSIWFLALLSISIIIANTVFAENPTVTEFEQTTKLADKLSIQPEDSVALLLEVIPAEPEIIYEEVDEVVYTLADTELYLEVDSDDSQQMLAHSTNLHRTGISEDWSRVEVSDEVFYVRNDQVATVTDQRLYDIDLIARTIHSEAGNQSEEGQRAVGSVIMNRKDYEGYGGSPTVEGVISFPNQFSSYKNSNWLAGYSDETYQIATEVYDGYTNLPREVRCFKSTYCEVEWSLEFYMQIGDHNFYYLP